MNEFLEQIRENRKRMSVVALTKKDVVMLIDMLDTVHEHMYNEEYVKIIQTDLNRFAFEIVRLPGEL